MVCSALLAIAFLFQPDPRALVPLYRQALELREKQLGPDHAKVARSASDLGLYLRKLGDREGALIYLRRALAIDSKLLSDDHPTVAEDLENIASLVPPAEAISLLTRAAACSDPGISARVLGRLGSLQERTGDKSAAIASYRKAIVQEEAASGRDSPRVAVRLNDLAVASDPKAAEPLVRRALGIQIKTLGPNHPETATTNNNLANILLATGRLAEAERVQRSALRALEASLGNEHPRVATACSNLADIVRAKGDTAGAKALYQRALAIDEKAYGPDHPEVAADIENLAGLLDEIGAKEEARKLRSRSR